MNETPTHADDGVSSQMHGRAPPARSRDSACVLGGTYLSIDPRIVIRSYSMQCQASRIDRSAIDMHAYACTLPPVPGASIRRTGCTDGEGNERMISIRFRICRSTYCPVFVVLLPPRTIRPSVLPCHAPTQAAGQRPERNDPPSVVHSFRSLRTYVRASSMMDTSDRRTRYVTSALANVS